MIEAIPKEICILVRVFNLGSGSPEVAFFLDPWECFMASQISLEAEGRYVARIRKNKWFAWLSLYLWRLLFIYCRGGSPYFTYRLQLTPAYKIDLLPQKFVVIAWEYLQQSKDQLLCYSASPKQEGSWHPDSARWFSYSAHYCIPWYVAPTCPCVSYFLTFPHLSSIWYFVFVSKNKISRPYSICDITKELNRCHTIPSCYQTLRKTGNTIMNIKRLKEDGYWDAPHL